MILNRAQFRFYAELNDFLPQERQFRDFDYTFTGRPAIKDSIEAIGVPHTEVDLILVKGRSVDFTYSLCDGDRVSVYPVFESLDIAPVLHLRPLPLRRSAFILDVHLGKLARRLRLLGFDCLYRNDYADARIVKVAAAEKRIVLTRDVGLLKNRLVTHGYWVRSTQANDQLAEVVQRFDLYSQIQSFSRCLLCNGLIEPVDFQTVAGDVPPRAAERYDRFSKCLSCGQVYWSGTHVRKLQELVDWILSRQNR